MSGFNRPKNAGTASNRSGYKVSAARAIPSRDVSRARPSSLDVIDPSSASVVIDRVVGDRFSRRETDARDETARSNRCARVGVIIDRARMIRRARGDDAANVFRRAFDADARSTMDDDAMDDVIAREARRDAREDDDRDVDKKRLLFMC